MHNFYIPLGCVVSLCLLGCPCARADEPKGDGIKFFEKRIRPILVDHCYRCHSSKAEQVEADLYVDTREGLLQGGDQGPAIVPGDPDASLLIKAVRYTTEDFKMPPDRRLDDEQIADLEKWVKIGAPDPRDGKNHAATTDRFPSDEARRRWPIGPPVERRTPNGTLPPLSP